MLGYELNAIFENQLFSETLGGYVDLERKGALKFADLPSHFSWKLARSEVVLCVQGTGLQKKLYTGVNPEAWPGGLTTASLCSGRPEALYSALNSAHVPIVN